MKKLILELFEKIDQNEEKVLQAINVVTNGSMDRVVENLSSYSVWLIEFQEKELYLIEDKILSKQLVLPTNLNNCFCSSFQQQIMTGNEPIVNQQV